MKNRYKVVKTTTNESNGVIHSWNTYQLVVTRDKFRKSLKEHFPHLSYYHLHIVDIQATIEVGDWCCSSEVYCPNENKHPPIWQRVNTLFPPGEPNDYKIVASTHHSLNLPMIPENFIEAFASNQGIKIADITFFDDMVEITCNDVDLYYTDNSTQKALNWWKNLNSFEQGRLTYLIKDDVYDNLSTKEIEAAYNKYAVSYAVDKLFNTVQAIRDGKTSIVKEVESEPEVEPEIDFELLKNPDYAIFSKGFAEARLATKSISQEGYDEIAAKADKVIANLELFFNQLKTNTNFAMEVHKRLQ